MSSSDVIAETDFLIIGAGIMGANIAYQLTKQTDKRVMLLDQSVPLGGMSGRTFGQIRLHYSNALLLEMAMRGYDYFSKWAEKIGYGNAGYVPMGYLLIVVEEQFEALNRNIELAKGLGIETRFVGPDEIGKIEPLIQTADLAGGAYDPNGGYIDITRISMSLLVAAQEAGLQLMTGQKVKEIETTAGKVSGVRTSSGIIKAQKIVAATGAWTSPLFEPLGIEVPIEARRLDTMYLRQPAGSPQIGCCITDGKSNVVVRPDMGRDVLAAAYPPQMPLASDPAENGDEADNKAHLARVRKAFDERLPALSGAVPLRSVSGSYDITPDWHPILGWVPGIDNLYMAAGFSGHGLKLSPAVGEIVAAELLENEPPFDPHPLRYQRFEEGEPMFLAYGPGGRA